MGYVPKQLTHVKGDILQYTLDNNIPILAHGCNCFCNFGAGLALQIKNTWKDVYLADKATKAGDITKLGSYTGYQVENGPLVLNLYTQYYYGYRFGRPFDYEAFIVCLRKLNHVYKGYKIALPKIGCGHGGASWERVSYLIRYELKNLDKVIVHLPP